MRTTNRQRIKEKRILVYWQQLTELRIDTDASIELIRYVFSIEEAWILRLIRKDLKEYDDIELMHIDLEIQLIDALCTKEY